MSRFSWYRYLSVIQLVSEEDNIRNSSLDFNRRGPHTDKQANVKVDGQA
jgi:hypothetical protein